MKLRIEKNENSEIQVFMDIDNESIEFHYPEFVRRIYYGDLPIEVEYVGSFDDDQKDKLGRMLREFEAAATRRSGQEDPEDE